MKRLNRVSVQVTLEDLKGMKVKLTKPDENGIQEIMLISFSPDITFFLSYEAWGQLQRKVARIVS